MSEEGKTARPIKFRPISTERGALAPAQYVDAFRAAVGSDVVQIACFQNPIDAGAVPELKRAISEALEGGDGDGVVVVPVTLDPVVKLTMTVGGMQALLELLVMTLAKHEATYGKRDAGVRSAPVEDEA